MQTFEEIVDNGLTSAEEVQMEINARESYITHVMGFIMADVHVSLQQANWARYITNRHNHYPR